MVRSNNYTERKGVLFCCIMLKRYEKSGTGFSTGN